LKGFLTLRPIVLGLVAVCAIARPAAAQQRPLVTQDPEPIGAGRLLIEGGVDYANDEQYPVSGLHGNLLRAPTIGLSFGLSSIAEFQIEGGLFDRLAIKSRAPAPLSNLLTVTGNSTHDFEDTIVATKIRVVAEGPGHPSFGLRFATKLPNAQNETGLGLDTTDFFATFLLAKTVRSVRAVGNVGVGILGDPTDGERQNDVITYSGSLARALTDRSELVGEVTGRWSTRRSGPLPGTESRSIVKFGARFTSGSIRLDGAVFLGLTTFDPTIGFTTGFTYVFHAFDVP
jgi:hypothetical protein